MALTSVPTVSGITPGLTVRHSGGAIVAHWLCGCGHYERVVGGAAVARLTSMVQVGVCPHEDSPERPAASRPAPVADLAAYRARRTTTPTRKRTR